MKKIKTLLFFLLVSTLTYGQITSGGNNTKGCGTCNDSNNDITVVDDDTFRARYAQAYWWEICDGNATIVGSNTSRNVNISCVIGQTSTIKLTRFINGNCIESCETFTCTAGGGGDPVCEASIKEIWCNKSVGPFAPAYPTMISVRFNLTNPFPNSASGYARWNDDYIDGQQDTGGVFGNLPGYQSDILPSQFFANISEQTTNWPSGFYVPMEVKYIDNVTGEVCIVTLNPLIQGPCGDIGPQRTSQEHDVKIHPNPSELNSNIKFEGIDIKVINSVEILDIMGNSKLKTKPINNTLSIKNLRPGVYFIKFDTLDGVVQKKLIIK